MARKGRHGGNNNRPHHFGGGGLFFGQQPDGFSRPEFVNKTCSADFACPLLLRRRNNNNDNDNDENQEVLGTFVCRTNYHPVSGTNRTRAICIPPDRGLESDECGCCGGKEDCPIIPEFQEITCSGQEDLWATMMMMSRRSNNNNNADGRRRGFDQDNNGNGFGGGGGRGGSSGPGNGGFGADGSTTRTPAIVCRELYNPFTGDKERVTIPIKSTKSLDGDVCGCCDGICPDEIIISKRLPFERPQQVELDWCTTAEELTSCTLPNKRRSRNHDNNRFQEETAATAEDPDNNDDNEQEGVFVCRSMANPLTGIAETRPVCISTDAAWDTDQCGCCGQACPEEKPIRADLGDLCDNDQQQECNRRNGQSGVFVCRSLFHPLEGNLVTTSLCIPKDSRAPLATDDCGCCNDGDSGCPVTPSNGFEDEDAQIMAFAMTVAGDITISITTDDDDDSLMTSVNAAPAAPTSGVVSRFSSSLDVIMSTSMILLFMVGAII